MILRNHGTLTVGETVAEAFAVMYWLERSCSTQVAAQAGGGRLRTPDSSIQSLMQAATFVQVIEERQGLKIGSIEEVAYRMGFIDAEQLKCVAEPLRKSGYGEYLLGLLK